MVQGPSNVAGPTSNFCPQPCESGKISLPNFHPNKLEYHHQKESCSASHWPWRQRAWLPPLLYMVSASLLQGQGTAGDPTLVLELATSPESPACSLQVPFTLYCSKILEFLPALKVSVSTSPASTYTRQARLYILLWLH